MADVVFNASERASKSTLLARLSEKFKNHITWEGIVQLYHKKFTALEKKATVKRYLDIFAEQAVERELETRYGSGNKAAFDKRHIGRTDEEPGKMRAFFNKLWSGKKEPGASLEEA